MAIISYDFGHMEGSQDTSANGYLYEYKVNREYGQVCVDVLKNAGHTMVNCTPSNGSCSTVGESLSYRANKSNQSGAVLHLCFHANCFDDENANGAEIEYASSKGAVYAQSVLNEICKLGFNSRGIKNPSLYMTGSHVNAVSILLEPFFVSNSKDCSIYNATTLGNAVAKGVLNVLGGNYNPSSSSITTEKIITPKTKKLQLQVEALIYWLNTDYAAKIKVRDKGAYVESELYPNLEAVGKIITLNHRSYLVKFIQQKLEMWSYLQKDSYTPMVWDLKSRGALTELQKKWSRPTDGKLTLDTWVIFLQNE